MNRRRFLASAIIAGAVPAASSAAAASGSRSRFLDDLTAFEIRDAVRAGAAVALLPTGGSEANGPQMALGKHNLIVRHCAGEIASRLGNALVAPVLSYVPEGGFDPPGDNMAFPGTIGVSPAAFAAVLRDAATSLALTGFKLICFLGDHGLSQKPQEEVAAALTRLWRQNGTRVANIARYYDAGAAQWLAAQGFAPAAIGDHAGLVDTAELMAVDPSAIRADLLSPRSWPPNAGASGDPARATEALGRGLIELKIVAALAEIRALASDMGLGGG